MYEIVIELTATEIDELTGELNEVLEDSEATPEDIFLVFKNYGVVVE